MQKIEVGEYVVTPEGTGEVELMTSSQEEFAADNVTLVALNGGQIRWFKVLQVWSVDR